MTDCLSRVDGMTTGRKLLLLVSLIVLGLDQLTKSWALNALSRTTTVPVIPGIFHLSLVHNSGVAFGLFKGYALAVGLATPFILLAVFWMNLSREKSSSQGTWAALGLVLGGAVGNLIDRIRWGAVVDFLDFRVWPVFNVADSCITVGAVVLAWKLLKGRKT